MLPHPSPWDSITPQIQNPGNTLNLGPLTLWPGARSLHAVLCTYLRSCLHAAPWRSRTHRGTMLQNDLHNISRRHCIHRTTWLAIFFDITRCSGNLSPAASTVRINRKLGFSFVDEFVFRILGGPKIVSHYWDINKSYWIVVNRECWNRETWHRKTWQPYSYMVLRC